jgi:hypothetical protein
MEGRGTIKRHAHSPTEPPRVVERARIVWLFEQGLLAPAIAKELHLKQETIRLWPTQAIDYGRRGHGYVFGAFTPADGKALTETCGRRLGAWCRWRRQRGG